MSPAAQAATLVNGFRLQVLHPAALISTTPWHLHLPQLFPQELISQLALPSEDAPEAGQVVSLVQNVAGRSEFDRRTGSAIREGYKVLPRTQVHEDYHEAGGWAGLVTLKLMLWANCRVTARLFVSRPGDLAFHEHRDAWFNFIVHLGGCKLWWLRYDLDSPPQPVEMRPGDALLMSEDVHHRGETPILPDGDNRSVHVQFAVVTSKPLQFAHSA